MARRHFSFPLVIVVIVIFFVGENPCQGFNAYFPMHSVSLNLPLNEKSQSIFSKIPLGRFQVLLASNNSVALNYFYRLENNDLLRINSTSGEIFIRDDYKNPIEPVNLIITATSERLTLSENIPFMSFQLNPVPEEEYCSKLENLCFWSSMNFTILEENSKSYSSNFQPIALGALNPRGAKYLCPSVDVNYRLTSTSDKFALQNNVLYSTVPLDHEALNLTESSNLAVDVICTIKFQQNLIKEFQNRLNVTVMDRNDNAVELQSEKSYKFRLRNPHFKEDDFIGEKIIFLDKDTLQTNNQIEFKILNDTSEIVKAACNSYEVDYTGNRNSIFGCQIVFARNGILSQSSYCFTLEASDNTVDVNVSSTAAAHVCLQTDPKKIHKADKPFAMALRNRQNRKRTEEEKLLGKEENGFGKAKVDDILSTYPKDVSVYRMAAVFFRVAQPSDYLKLMQVRGLKFTIAEDRSNAFGITSAGGIVYIKDVMALLTAPETIYFLNITWHDSYQRSFVINIHLINDRPGDNSCDFKIKSRSQTCAQVKYEKQCLRFCGMGTSGGSCIWRGSNAGFFSVNYASCVPDEKHCPDNICDPLEDMNPLLCPQDCTHSNRIVGPHSVNDNNRGILAASGTCICEDNGKCMCAPLDDEDSRPKRKRKNEIQNNSSNHDAKISNNSIIDPYITQFAGLSCGKSCLLIFISCPLIILTFLVCVFVTRRKLKIRNKETLTLDKEKDHQSVETKSGNLPLIEVENGFNFDTIDSKWDFDRDKLNLDDVLGEGEFGKVVKAYASDMNGIPGKTTVAVKMLKKGANSVEYMALLSEFQLLQEVSHPNVIKLLGACINSDAPLIIIEYARYGSLRNYLRLSRKIDYSGVDFTDGVEPVTVKNVLSFAWQICKGMAYLAEIKLVHRDLAARNVLLADQKICKISDFGLTRDVYEDDAYLKQSRDRVPVKWMAPESLADHVYTTKSDVWAFGILCWEVITLGASPYPGIPPQNLYHLLKTGYRMERPENCSDEVYNIIRNCWIMEPSVRPSFKYLAAEFEKLLGNHLKEIELMTNAVSNPIYCSDETTKVSNLEYENRLDENLIPESLDHLWYPPKIGSDFDCPIDSPKFSNNLNFEMELLPFGYDMPRPLIESSTTEQPLRYQNELRFPWKFRKSSFVESCSNNGDNISNSLIDHYSVPMKRGRSYMDMTHRNHIPNNLNAIEFEKHISKTISFRFSSDINLKLQQDSDL